MQTAKIIIAWDLIIDSISYKAHYLLLELSNLLFDQQLKNAAIFLSCDIYISVICPIRAPYEAISKGKWPSSYEWRQ